MDHPTSVFIMDISNSSKVGVGTKLSKFLHQLEQDIKDWTSDGFETKVVHRSGDEIVLVSSDYATAYTIAFYINHIWPFKDHQPYFGLSFGHIQTSVNELDIETWIHPLMKQAKEANDMLKVQQAPRDQFMFKLASSVNHPQFETLFNTILTLQQDQMNDQTTIQALVCSMSFILNQQNKVSNYLDRSASTVSSHIKKGKYESIIGAFNDIVKVLISLQSESTSQAELLNQQLQQNIRQIISNQLTDYFPVNKK